eukprot:jgi/Tetstr1/421668/TSEL_012607.t1
MKKVARKEREQPEPWMFSNQAFEEALARGSVAVGPLTSRGMRTMEEEHERLERNKAERPVQAPPAASSPAKRKPRPAAEVEGPSRARKFRFKSGKVEVEKEKEPQQNGWTFTNPLALLEPDSGAGTDLERAIELAKERASSRSSSAVPPLSLGDLPAHIASTNNYVDSGMFDSDDEDEEVVMRPGEKYPPVVTPRDYEVPEAAEDKDVVEVVAEEEVEEQERVGEKEEATQTLKPSLSATNRTNRPTSWKAPWKNLKQLDINGESQPVSSPALSEKEKLSLQTPQAVMTPLSFAKARLGQHVTFDSPKSPLTRPQECFTPSYSRTSAPAGTWTRCSVERVRKKGNGKSSKFVLRSDSGEILLAAKRSKMDRAIKFFCPNWETNYSECVGIAHYDTLGAQFVLRGADMREKVTTDALMALLFGLTTEGPRQITVALPAREDIQPIGATIEDMPTLGGPSDVSSTFKAIHLGIDSQDVQVFRSAMPVWDSIHKTYRMDFNGRVRKPSVKNMKLQARGYRAQHDAENDDPQKSKETTFSRSMFICGRITANTFACDFQAPLTPLEAFCIACADLIHKPIYNWI